MMSLSYISHEIIDDVMMTLYYLKKVIIINFNIIIKVNNT